MIIMDGRALRDKYINKFKKRIAKLSSAPHITFIQVGNNPASEIYLKNKSNFCKLLGISSNNISLPEKTSFDQLKKEIERLNQDDSVDGILVQFPLPKGMSKREVALLINPTKDADGIHPYNQGIALTNTKIKTPLPATPKGIMALLKEYKIDVAGKHAVVIGRSNIAGRPMSNQLINADATVSLLHSHTSEENKKTLLKSADIIVTATGSKDVFDPSYVKEGVVIVDVGIIKEEGKIRGDIRYKDFENIASYITPVPGGVGPMTVTMLMDNIITNKENKEA